MPFLRRRTGETLWYHFKWIIIKKLNDGQNETRFVVSDLLMGLNNKERRSGKEGKERTLDFVAVKIGGPDGNFLGRGSALQSRALYYVYRQTDLGKLLHSCHIHRIHYRDLRERFHFSRSSAIQRAKELAHG